MERGLAMCKKLLTAAIKLAELGFPVFPISPGAKSPPLTPHGFKDSCTDIDVIQNWWEKYPNANIGMATEGLVVVDVDPHQNGEDNLWPFDPNKQISLAVGPMAITPRGGRHYIFRQPPGKSWGCTQGKLSANVDTRANGGYLVVPPSLRTDKQGYRWIPEMGLDDPPDQLPEPPKIGRAHV